MATAQRVLWETITVAAFVLLLVGTVLWSGGRVDRHRARLDAEHEAKVAASEEDHRQREADLEQEFERKAREHAIREAKAVFEAFEAGIHSAVASRWGNYTNRAKTELLGHPSVTFVHIVTPSGLIMASSDEKLSRTGRIDERFEWPLSHTELAVRENTEASDIEVAGPIVDNGQTIAHLWLGYDIDGAVTPSTDTPAVAP